MTDLGTLGGTNRAKGINEFGQIVGIATNYSRAYGINAVGQIVGFSNLTGDASYHPVIFGGVGFKIWERWVPTTIEHRTSITSARLSASQSPPDDVDNHAFPYSNGPMVDLNTQIPANSGWELNFA